MTAQPTPIALAVAGLLLATAGMAQAQSADPAKDDAQTVIITGIRASRQQSLAAKRDADSVVEVITAEDIGKLPDKNVADAIQRLPGINISSAAGGEGGFSENDRVSIRGTSPSLTQTLINGHPVATGDWFVLDQTETVGRSVSYTLLPSEIVSRVVVRKSAQADLVEGGVSGAVDIETRTPLSFKKPLTLEASAQVIYADLPKKYDPQLNALVNWKNEAGTFGVLFQAFSEARHERRDGQEFLGYGELTMPDGSVVKYPSLIGSALFTQKRVRTGGVLDVELKPSNTLTLDANAFFSHLAATNYDTNFMANPQALFDAGVVPDSMTVRNGTIVSAVFPTITYDPAHPEVSPGVVDKIYRPGAKAETYYVDFNGKYKPTDRFTFSGKLGYTHGIGSTPGDLGYESLLVNSGMRYDMNGIGAPATVSFPGANPANYNEALPFGTWYSTVHVLDEETYAQADAEMALDSGIWESLKFGLRYAKHRREVQFPQNGGCGWADGGCGGSADWHGEKYPGNFGSGFGAGAGFLRDVWHLSPEAVQAYVLSHASSGPTQHYWQGELGVQEQTLAAYGMANFSGSGWRANAGVRLVQTRQRVNFNVPDGPNPITGSDYGPYTPTTVSKNYFDALPSANIKFDLSKQLVARLAVARTIARADYSALAGAITSLDDLTLSGTGGNPELKPVRSTNYDATLEWYFAPKALASVGVFFMDMSSYVGFGTSQQSLFNKSRNQFDTYSITSPVNVKAKNKGVELSLSTPIGGGFGAVVNYTYTDGKDDAGGRLTGSSRNTGNLEAYYENDRFSARLAYTYRSDFLVGLDRSTTETAAAVGNLAASVNVKLTDSVSITFDALNLNNPVLKYYGDNKDQPRAFYSNGRQYYLGVRVAL
ncbi:TonB-dependent receptor [Ideonella sp. BN130291]|uniref:TonB-dependent receptor n=1 Tax=Ideonella sp. BN130291 TaxID=3112940 RepID=UPI002E263C4D|nr:TonB-dependent receptor [Ideonella sp. BN130291]